MWYLCCCIHTSMLAMLCMYLIHWPTRCCYEWLLTLYVLWPWLCSVDPYYNSTCLPLLFRSEWRTTEADQTLTLPLSDADDHAYNFTISWGDGSPDEHITQSSAASHVFADIGTYVFVITGTLTGFAFNNEGDKENIFDIVAWGPLKFGNAGGYFYGCSSLVVSAMDSPDMEGTFSLHDAFWEATLFNQDINNWDVSSVSTLHNTFRSASAFNQAVSSWDVSSVTTLYRTFYLALVLGARP